MSSKEKPKPPLSFRHFFFRGLGIILPTVLTIWILVAVYQFVEQKIADPLNAGIRQAVLLTGWPRATDEDYTWISERLKKGQAEEFEDKARLWIKQRKVFIEQVATPDSASLEDRLEARRMQFVRDEMSWDARYHNLDLLWNSVKIGDWVVLDISGLIVAVFIIFFIGRLLGGFVGRGLLAQGERLLLRVPLFKQIYPYVKQVTDFFVGEKDDKIAFNNVVAVEYPRKGLWSVGLVTGSTMQSVEDAAGAECLTVFIPSSPTPFTGYVITVPRNETIDLGISIDDALRFAVSGGVIVPPSQTIGGPQVAGQMQSTPDRTSDPPKDAAVPGTNG